MMNDTGKSDGILHDDLCNDMYMTMYMDGFHWSLLFTKSPPNVICLNYLVSTWRVQYPSEFRGCMLYTFLLAILLEAISSLRNMCLQNFNTTTALSHHQQQQQQQQQQRRTGTGLRCHTIERHRHYYDPLVLNLLRHSLVMIMYGIQTMVGYLLMLIAMSYSIELLLSIFLGLCIGNILFVRYNLDHTTNTTDDEFDFDDEDPVDNMNDNSNYIYHEEEQSTRTTNAMNQNNEIQSLLSNNGKIRRRG